MFFEAGPQPRNARVIYDRKNSAAAGMTMADADWPALIAASARVHLSGITPALSASCTSAGPGGRGARRPRQEAALLRPQLPLDLDHPEGSRGGAGGGGAASRTARRSPSATRRNVLGFAESGERLAEAVAARYGAPLVALTRPPAPIPATSSWRTARSACAALPGRDRRPDRRRRLVCRRADPRSARRRPRQGDPARRLCRCGRARHARRHQLFRARGLGRLRRRRDRPADALNAFFTQRGRARSRPSERCAPGRGSHRC